MRKYFIGTDVQDTSIIREYRKSLMIHSSSIGIEKIQDQA